MNYFAVSDIFGKDTFNNDTPFILIHLRFSKMLIEEIDTYVFSQRCSIWRFKPKYLSYILRKFNLDPTNFTTLGHIYFPTKQIPAKTTFLLANKKKPITTSPINYIKVLNIGDGYIWKPIAPTGYIAFGYLYNVQKPSLIDSAVISKMLVSKNIANAYNYLLPNNQTKYGIDINKYIKYLKADDVASVYSQDTIDSWMTPKGKYIVFTEPDEPWYISKRRHKYTNHPIMYNKDLKNLKGFDKNLEPQNAYKSNVELDTTKPNMGLGYSIKDRLCRGKCSCKKHCKKVIEPEVIEPFNNQNNKEINIVISILLSIIISIFIFKMILSNLPKSTNRW